MIFIGKRSRGNGTVRSGVRAITCRTRRSIRRRVHRSCGSIHDAAQKKTFLKALTGFAAKSGHPEIDKVPWALWGHSGGGIWSDVMTTLHPDRVIAVWMRSGSALMFLSHPEFTRPDVPTALYKIPMMINPGVKEKPKTPPPDPDTRH